MVADELFVDLTPAPLRSFEDFYRDSHERMARALTLTLGNRSLALDATDEAFARAWSRWATVCSHTNPEGWVYRVALNWATSWLRKVRRERPDVYIDRPAPATGRDLDLDRALERLSVDHRSVVVLRHLGGWSTEEVANALEISPGTVKSRLSRALDQLSADLNDPERSSP
ncbi:MAG: sigma-70 family RNA polymerase sigma factor [Actinomycetia bacterium]|nr:sigma-70 family RNA polymerase sigma factor [Actinomycetes bacterium]